MENLNAQVLSEDYKVTVPPDARNVECRHIVIKLTKSANTCPLIAPQKDEHDIVPSTIMLLAVVCDEYSLMNTSASAGVNINSGKEVLNKRMYYNGAYYSDVILPGQEKQAYRTVFEPPTMRMPLARELFKEWTPELCNVGIVRMKLGTDDVMLLCMDMYPDGTPVCPLGFLISHSSKGRVMHDATIQKGTFNGDDVQRSYYRMPSAAGEKLYESFKHDAKDPRPIVNTKTLTIEALFDEKASPEAVLCMKLSAFYYSEKR
jgi:hypothetical protein